MQIFVFGAPIIVLGFNFLGSSNHYPLKILGYLFYPADLREKVHHSLNSRYTVCLYSLKRAVLHGT